MKKFDLKNHLQEWDIEEYIPDYPLNDDYASDLRVVNKAGDELKSYISRDKNGYREVVLGVLSLRGSVGAVHFYGKISDYSIHFTRLEDTENKSSLGGYGTSGVPTKYQSFKLEIQRPVTARDIQYDKDNQRESYMRLKKGQLTRGFWNEEDVIEIGKQVFEAIYRGKWKLRIDRYSGNGKREYYFLKDSK